jgi:hypothetical protein
MNWTSTKVPMWQVDCENFRRSGAVELQDVSTPEQKAFVQAFALKYDMDVEWKGSTVRFLPKPKKQEIGFSPFSR